MTRLYLSLAVMEFFLSTFSTKKKTTEKCNLDNCTSDFAPFSCGHLKNAISIVAKKGSKKPTST